MFFKEFMMIFTVILDIFDNRFDICYDIHFDILGIHCHCNVYSVIFIDQCYDTYVIYRYRKDFIYVWQTVKLFTEWSDRHPAL